MNYEGLPLDRTYKTLVIDPPWQYDQSSAPQVGVDDEYSATIGIKDLEDLPVTTLTETNAHVWLWYTNAFFKEAAHLLDVWGLTVISQLTWIKPGMGMGSWLRNSTEHCVHAKYGHIPVLESQPRNLQSYLQAPRARHSRKPDEAYDIIREISPGPRLDMFARSPRVGFDRWGNQLLEWDGISYIQSEHLFLEASQ